MKTLEIRRHSMRKSGGGSQLSQAGVAYARRLGASLGPFAQVVTSVVPRARETAIAMGFAVDYELVTLVSDEELYAEAGLSRWWEATYPFSALGDHGHTRFVRRGAKLGWRGPPTERHAGNFRCPILCRARARGNLTGQLG